MTIYEWRITDCGNGEFGYIWIAEAGKDEFGTIYKVWVDPDNCDAWVGKVPPTNSTGNIIAGMECPEEFNQYQHDPSWYKRILFYWRKLGCPRIDQKAPGYDAPWFPWTEAGFTDAEVSSCVELTGGDDDVENMVGGISASELVAQEDARFEKAAEAAAELESE